MQHLSDIAELHTETFFMHKTDGNLMESDLQNKFLQQFKKEVSDVYLDPFLEVADTDVSNNSLPRRPALSKFQIFKNRSFRWGADGRQNPMQKAKKIEEMKEKK